MTSHFEFLTQRFNFYFSTFELLTRSWKIKNYTASYWLEVGKYLFSLRVTNSVVKPLFRHFLVTNVKLINETSSLNVAVRMFVNPLKSILLLKFRRTSYNSTSSGCPGMLKCTQILVFLAPFIDRLPWTLANT